MENTNKIPQTVIDELGLTEEEIKHLENTEINVRDFVLGLRRLSRDTGVTVCSNDYGDCYVIEPKDGQITADTNFKGLIVADGTTNSVYYDARK